MTDYSLMKKEIEALTNGVSNLISNLSNISALMNMELSDINWAGFYFVDGENLILGPFQGKPACVKLQVGKGVCGTAVKTGEIQLVENVHNLEGHIACDSASNSEIVVPLRNKEGKIIAVLDIDSPTVSRFSEDDAKGLAEVCKAIEYLF